MCSGNDSGNIVMQKTLWCDSLYRQNISTLEIHCHLMLVFGDGVQRPHSCRERVKRVQEWVGIHHEDCIFQLGRSRTWTQRKWWNWFWKTIKTQFKIYPLHWINLWKLYPTLSMYSWDTASCVHGVYQDMWWKFTKIDVWRCSFTSLVI
jgi:hypothetical protein